MKIIIDECISTSTKQLLVQNGFEIIHIDEILQFGIEDEAIYEYATQNQITIITHDRRFGRIYFDSSSIPAMVIVLRIVNPHPEATNILLNSALKQIDIRSAQFNHKLILIDTDKIRIRSKPF